ncbi:hypothetical protein G187_gp06 [Cronobacter phage ENT47670]|uniref:hypothetical protein n=1 Tax=Cronobacter phage ENT47670 TaxID=984186 RepID=UPI000201F598|nr:hypothetical protein G187_gp06 [Cronobacter phage ENT47670]ADZ13660.1 hypothetical protein [Cronobacter phage ENT47670]
MRKSNATYAAKALLRLPFTVAMAMKSCATNAITTFTTLMMKARKLKPSARRSEWSGLNVASGCRKRMQSSRCSHASRVATYRLCIILKDDGMTHTELCQFARMLPTGCHSLPRQLNSSR